MALAVFYISTCWAFIRCITFSFISTLKYVSYVSNNPPKSLEYTISVRSQVSTCVVFANFAFNFFPIFRFTKFLYVAQISFSSLSSISPLRINVSRFSILFHISTHLSMCNSHVLILFRYACGRDVPHLYIASRIF